MKNMNTGETGKIRTVSVNDRGQIVIPEDIRRDFGIDSATTLVIVERGKELVIKKEAEVLAALGDETFWRTASRASLNRAWSKEDAVWDEFFRKEK